MIGEIVISIQEVCSKNLVYRRGDLVFFGGVS